MSIIKNDWQYSEAEEIYNQDFFDLIHKSAIIHRENFNPKEIQISTLLSIKTGSCPEDCKYCPQSAHYNTDLEKEDLIDVDEVIKAAKAARDNGASRFCMGAAWKKLNDRDLPKIANMIETVKSLGLETCMTLGMVNKEQAIKLQESGLDYYNHNIDTSEDYYKEIITTRTFQDRIDTIEAVRDSGMKVCCGGIIGMGEKKEDRINMLLTLANLEKHPESVPINMLVKVAGTPLHNQASVDVFDFIKTIALARILMPKSYVRLSAGREDMDESTQALCFYAGANSIFYGEKLLTTKNPSIDKDKELFKKLGLEAA